MERCDKCSDYIFSWEKHYCEPFVIENMEDGDTSTVHAKYEEDAVERYGTNYNEDGDYPLMNGGALKVRVNNTIYEVIAEASIDYTVSEVQDTE